MRISALGAPCFLCTAGLLVLVQEVASRRVVGEAPAALATECRVPMAEPKLRVKQGVIVILQRGLCPPSRRSA